MSGRSGQPDFVFKVLLIGDAQVGKTSLLVQYTENKFAENLLSTIGVDFKDQTVEIGDKKARLQIWDTAGQERFRTIVRTFYRGVAAIVVVYDVTKPESFQHVETWMREIGKHADTEHIEKVLVGNKSDLEQFRQVPTEDGVRFADRLGVPFLETSAKDGRNVKQIFDELAKRLLDSRLASASPRGLSGANDGDKGKKKGGCC